MNSLVLCTVLIFLFITISLAFNTSNQTAKQKINIYAIEADGGEFVIAAQHLAIAAINNDSELLSDYELSIHTLNANDDTTTALMISLDIATKPSPLIFDNETISIPILLGTPYSYLSIITNPVLAAFNWGQISSSSTSVLLSDKFSYPTFYRTVADDNMQSKGIGLLCKQFNWTEIGIMYIGDVFGVYLTSGILAYGKEFGYSAYAIQFVNNANNIKNAVQSIRSIGVYIIVIIAHSFELSQTFEVLNQYGLVGFPYYYIGVDSWFDAPRIVAANISNYTKGYIGTVPWQPTALTKSTYDSVGLTEVYFAAKNTYELLKNQWHNRFEEYPSNDLPTFAIYGYDSVYALAIAMEIYDELYDLESMTDFNISTSLVYQRLSDIMHDDDYYFLSATGNVSFKENNDRNNGLYAFGNVINDEGSIRYFGFFGDNDIFAVEYETIIWPDDFITNNIIPPRSNKLVTYKLAYINHIVFYIYVSLSALSMILVFISLGVTWKFRNNVIIRAASWKLNVLTCIGCLMVYLCVILYGLDVNNILCNIREWILAISFTLIFMPLFMKTYRLSIIFTGMLIVQEIHDPQLVLYVMICVLVDVIIMSVFTGIEMDTVEYLDGSIESINALHDEQTKYAVCSKSTTVDVIFYSIMFGWKACQLIFGIYVAGVVSRVSMKQIQKFNETKSQLFAIRFSICLFLIVSIPLLLRESDDETYFFIILSTVSLLLGNVILWANIVPRLLSVYKEEEDEYKLTETEIITKELAKKIRQISRKSLKYLYIHQDTSDIKISEDSNDDDNILHQHQPKNGTKLNDNKKYCIQSQIGEESDSHNETNTTTQIPLSEISNNVDDHLQ